MKDVKHQKNAILLRELVKTDFKLRYQNSALGYLWALLKPLLMFAILYVVFTKILRFGDGIPHYPVYLLVGTVFWNFFTECTFLGIHAIEMRGDLIRKVNFPKYIVVISATSTALINLLINVGVILIFALINGCTLSLSWLLVIPSIIELYVLALGISLWLGAINVKLRDIGSIWEVITQALFYAVPIIYPISMVTSVSTAAANIILVNPIAQAIQDVRHNIVTDQTVTTWEFVGVVWGLVSVLVVIAVLVFGAFYFKRRSRKFAEEV